MSIKNWAPRILIRPTDHIISSSYTHSQPFVPSYEKEPVDMFLLMANTYAKIWAREKTHYQKQAMDSFLENNAFLMRRYVIKGLQKRLKKLAEMKEEPARMKTCKKVPYAVRLLPRDCKKSKAEAICAKLN
ncbi:Hypothetical protein NTJ_16097 [Nesidiocoris tenuis]|uniref:Uncharacterized protein n=1 Tax=Nesidiocoris tenuis TaxID=355587 RepID=A0ABN7BHE6_9HEMI|nr:Hypothetical protein NTJ_16097 [Nesidiocoris tenuis]